MTTDKDIDDAVENGATMRIDNPTQAFPAATYDPEQGALLQEGLTKREWFAGMAMQGLCVNIGRNHFNFGDLDAVADEAFRLSDTMLQAGAAND